MSEIQVAPAPWKLTCRSWIFLLSPLSKSASFPAGFSAPNEADIMTTGGEFIGGPGQIQLVSYTDSPVGPYDELIYVPGRWKYANGNVGFRITRIYVSSKESTANGRRNWNIPKQVADFDYSPGTNGTTNFSVTLPGSSTPFFKASIKPIPILSSISIPATTTILGSYSKLIQPPLPAGDKPEEVSTTQWAELVPIMKGSVRMVSVVPGFEGGKVGDSIAFPAVQPWGVGTAMEGVDVDFGVSTFYDSL
ncbi:hypothetical protein BDQ12DRAFT_684030 [Crucibulum laeve]|uniref:Uncharacterized protein n=1 Tax=Crucibulum laeve TaxID=68775 RepID=A0A5C3LY20_9AGAR|nr:hypothetical protein BDQ12DRAFT_684030 [Crucibulum laeve]